MKKSQLSKPAKWMIATVLVLPCYYLLYLIGNVILHSFGLAFSLYVKYTGIVLCFLLPIVLVLQVIVQLFVHAHRKASGYIFSTVLSIVLLAGTLALLLFFAIFAAFRYGEVEVVQIENEKMFEHEIVNAKEWAYYPYKNLLVRGQEMCMHKTRYSTTRYYYDDEGERIKRIEQDRDGNVIEAMEDFHSNEGEGTRTNRYDEDGNLTETIEYFYDDEGNHIKTLRYDGKGDLTEMEEYSYIDGNKYQKVTRYNAYGFIVDTDEHYYKK